MFELGTINQQFLQNSGSIELTNLTCAKTKVTPENLIGGITKKFLLMLSLYQHSTPKFC